MYIQLITAGLKTSLHLTPFCLLDLILETIKNEKKIFIKYRDLSDCESKIYSHLIGSLISPDFKYFKFIF